MIVIGSKALLSFIPDKERWNISDFDVLMTPEEFKSWTQEYKKNIKKLIPRSGNKYKAILEDYVETKQYEIEIGYKGTSAEWLLSRQDEITSPTPILGFLGEFFHALRLQYQLVTKYSHIIYPVHFEKNINDYHLIKSNLWISKIDNLLNVEDYQEYYDIRHAEAKEKYSEKFKTPNLHVTNEDFFSSKLAVKTYFIHDHIHEVMKHYDQPVYEMMKRDFSLAKCEEDMFFSLEFEKRIRCVQEEAYVIALERYIIPQAGDFCDDHFECYKKALQRICTTLCSGWFRKFAIENYPKVIEMYDRDFVQKFVDSYYDGKIKIKDNVNNLNVPLGIPLFKVNY